MSSPDSGPVPYDPAQPMNKPAITFNDMQPTTDDLAAAKYSVPGFHKLSARAVFATDADRSNSRRRLKTDPAAPEDRNAV